MAHLPYSTAGWSRHIEIKQPVIERPLPRQLSHFTVLRTYEGPAATYQPLSLDTVDAYYDGSTPSRPRAHLVQQGSLDNSDGGQVRYTRLFATIPAPYVDFVSDPYAYPAVAESTAATAYAITAMAHSLLTPTICTFMSSTLTGVSVGDLVYLSLLYLASNGQTQSIAQRAKVTAIVGSVYTVANFFPASADLVTFTSGSVAKITPGRSYSRTQAVPHRLSYDYTLTSAPDAIALPEYFMPIQAVAVLGTDAGVDVTLLNTNTLPTAADYVAMISSGAQLVVSATLDNYLGNIWRRTVRTVTAR